MIEVWAFKAMTRCTDTAFCGWVEDQPDCAHPLALLGSHLSSTRAVCPECGERTERAIGRPHMRVGKYGLWPFRVKTYTLDHVEWKTAPGAKPNRVFGIPRLLAKPTLVDPEK